MSVSTTTAVAKKGKAELAEQLHFSPEQIQLLKDTVAKGCSDNEFLLFLHIAKTYGLDPLIKEVWCLKYASNQPATIFTSRDGYLKIASRDVQMDGIQSDVVYANDLLEKLPDGTVKHTYGQPRGAILGAYALVFRKDRSRAAYFFAPFAEYGTGSNPTWKKYPSAMIVKVAEAMALKRAFSISGLVTQEEMGLDAQPDAVQDTETSAVMVAPEVPKKAPAGAVPPASAPPAPSATSAPSGPVSPQLQELRGRITDAVSSFHITPGEQYGAVAALPGMDLATAQKAFDSINKRIAFRQTEAGREDAQHRMYQFAEQHAVQLGEVTYQKLITRSKSLTAKAVELLTDIERATEWLATPAAA